MNAEVFQLQMEEIHVMWSIYGKEWKAESKLSQRFSYSMCEGGREATLYFYLPDDYPVHSPPTVEMSAPSLSRQQKAEIYDALNAVYLKNIGKKVLFEWAEKVREILQSLPDMIDGKIQHGTKYINNKDNSNTGPCPEIIHGDVIEDRRSVFQGHVAKITKPSDVEKVLKKLKQEKKIAAAKHNIVAWRCADKNDFDDDGERTAGGRLMKALEQCKTDNVVVIVTRWFGGIQIGPARFRHINNAARQALLKAKFK